MYAVLQSWHLLARGLLVTLGISASVILFGTIIGIFGGVGLLYGRWPVRWLLRLYVDIVRGTPLLVLIFAFYYVVPGIGIPVPAWLAGVIALGVFAGAHVSEIVRGAVGSIPKSQFEAAKSIGLTFKEQMRWVIFPQAVRRAIPPWVNTCVEMVKASSLVALVSIVDLLFAAQQVIERTRQAMPLYITLAVIYFTINFSISRVGRRLERRFAYYD